MESSRRDLLNDMAEHRSILKNNQNTHYPRFGFTLKTSTEPPNGWIVFTVRNRKISDWEIYPFRILFQPLDQVLLKKGFLF